MTSSLKSGLIYASPLIVGGVALFMGAYAIAPSDVIQILTGSLAGAEAETLKAIVLDIRLPRILLAGIVGLGLSVSGATLQGIFRNPLVDPYILGISSGAALGCAVTIGFMPWLPVQVMAFAGGLLAAGLAFAMARTQGEVTRLALILSGVIVSSFFTALVSAVKFLVDPHALQNIVYWLMGSFALADWQMVTIAAIGIGLGAIPLVTMRWRLNALSMGEDEARLLGVNLRRERFIFIASATLCAAIAVSVSGIIGWIGLMVPHLVRMISGPNHKSLIPLSMAGGAAVMILSDTIARDLTAFDLPVGIITAVIGAPFFFYLMKRQSSQLWRG